MSLKTKILIGVVAFLFLTNVVSSIYGRWVDYENEKAIEKIIKNQEDKLNEKEDKLIKITDSIADKLNTQLDRVNRLERSLNESLKQAEINNMEYEKRKEAALAVSDADSLAYIFTERYKKK